MEKHLVIGGSGLVGSYLCKEIYLNDKQVIGTYCNNLVRKENYPFVKLDITNFNETKSLIKAILLMLIFH